MAKEDRGARPLRMHVTPRQAEILHLVACGLSDKEIALRLGVSPRTIQSHLDRFYVEHGLHKRAAAVAAWLQERPGQEPASSLRVHQDQGQDGIATGRRLG
jgi:DNA-binding NarL/FixJ family response regulator